MEKPSTADSSIIKLLRPPPRRLFLYLLFWYTLLYMKKGMILTIIISIVVIGFAVTYMFIEYRGSTQSTNQVLETPEISINTDVPVTNNNTQQNMQETTNNISHTAVFSTSMGSFTVAFYDESPKTVENFIKLAKAGFYNGVRFHRVIKDFMIQSGDPLSKDEGLKQQWGTGGPGYQFADEFNEHPLVRGSLAMANAGPNTNGSQFFIVTAESTPWLDGKHTNFGYVTEGMDVITNIENVQTDNSDHPIQNVTIDSINIQ